MNNTTPGARIPPAEGTLRGPSYAEEHAEVASPDAAWEPE